VFAAIPNFRGYYHGAERMLLNALFLGPGFGTAARVTGNCSMSFGPRCCSHEWQPWPGAIDVV
jgi:hypothetical protein